MSNEQALVRAAREAEAGGDLAAARGHYEQLLAQDPQQPNAVNGLARLALMSGDANAALAMLGRLAPARTEIPLLTDSLMLKAAAHRALGQQAEEDASLGQALAADAYCWPALLQRAQLLDQLDRIDQAIGRGDAAARDELQRLGAR